MWGSIKRWLRPSLILTVGVSPAVGQTGSVAGRVTDAGTRAAVPGVQVRAVDTVGAVSASSVSDGQGRYRVIGLRPGSYTLLFNRVGYAPQRVSNVVVSPGASVDVSAALDVVALQLAEEVVTASRRQEKALDAPASVAVVTAARIEERPALTPIDHLKSVPGLDVAQTGLLGSSVVTRGFNNIFSGALLTLTDYRYAHVPSLRVNIPYFVPTVDEDVDRMEVLLGPAAALYGPNSANGVLHLITKSPFESRGTTLSVGGGERALVFGSMRHAATVSGRFGFKVGARYMRGDDWRFEDSAEVAAREQDGTLPARSFGVSRWGAEGRADWRVTDSAELIVAAGLTEAGSAVELTGIGAAQVDDWRYHYYQARFRAKRLFAQAFVNQSDAGETLLLRTGQRIVDDSRMLVGQLQHGFALTPRQSVTYGVDVQRTEPRTGGTINGRNEGDDDIDEIGGYVHSATRLSPRLEVVAAARADRHSRIDGPIFSPRAAVVYAPRQDQNLRLTYNRAFSTPTSTNLFLDITAGRLSPLPFAVRTVGVPREGFAFRRDCAGSLCIRSPFAPDSTALLPLDAAQFWSAATQLLFQQTNGQIDIRQIPAPTPQQVPARLRVLNPTTQTFATVEASDVRDIAQLKPTISNTVELGYKGLLAGRVSVAADLWWQHRDNFIGPLVVETPNVFFDRPGLEAYLTSRGVSPAQAAAIASTMAGLPNSTDPRTKGIPLATVTPDNRLTRGPSLLLTYRNFGEVELWGSDLALEALVNDRVSLTGTYSSVSDDFFPKAEIGGISDIALNAPRNKGTLGVRYDDRPTGWTVDARLRYVDAFPMNSGVYVGDVKAYTLVDLGVVYRMPRLRGTLFSLSAQNLLDKRHREFVGAPRIGRLILGKVTYTAS